MGTERGCVKPVGSLNRRRVRTDKRLRRNETRVDSYYGGANLYEREIRTRGKNDAWLHAKGRRAHQALLNAGTNATTELCYEIMNS